VRLDLDSPRLSRACLLLIPVCFGLISLWLGADCNFDLLNYHFYNAYAFLDGRIGRDLAPASLQSYFNPVLDVSYFVLTQHWPRFTGFLMGLLHGLNFLLLLGIARSVLPLLPSGDRLRVPLLLALAGCFTGNFLSELGNSMGDDSTALFVLGAVYLLLKSWPRLTEDSWRASVVVLVAGGIAGMGAGLKLTNSIYAVALCMAFLVLPLRWPLRIKLAFVFGCGVLAGLALTGGYWLLHMWQLYGDPLYPQFTTWFPSPLARSTAVADTKWLPKGVLEFLTWPFIIAWNPRRVGQIELYQLIWPLLYVLFGWWAVARLRGRARGADAAATDGRPLFLLAIVAVGFWLWAALFSIYRYLVPIEMLAPLALFLLCIRLRSYTQGRRVTAWILGAATLLVLLDGCSWGHEGWNDVTFRADMPAIGSPANTTILLVGIPPYGWLTPSFPEEVTFAGVRRGFPESSAYVARVLELVTAPGRHGYAVVQAHYNWRQDSLAHANRLTAGLGLRDGAKGCGMLHWSVDHLHLHAVVSDSADGGCELLLAPTDAEDIQAEDEASSAEAAGLLSRYGLVLDRAACVRYMGHVGTGSYPYQWCPVVGRGALKRRM
jgi:hypothetical protein